MNPEEDKRKALEIAQKKFLEFVPPEEKDLYDLDIFPIKNPEYLKHLSMDINRMNYLWYIRYKHKSAEDADIEIVVDVGNGKIMHFKNMWA